MDLARRRPTKWSRLIAFPDTNGRVVLFRWFKCQTALLPNREENVCVLSRLISQYTKLMQLVLALKYTLSGLFSFTYTICNWFFAVTNEMTDVAGP